MARKRDCPDKKLLSGSLDNSNNCFVIDQDLSIPGMYGLCLNVVRGLICFTLTSKKACVYNPTTRQLLTLPAIIAEQGETMEPHYYMVHDSVNDQYKLVCTTIAWPYDTRSIKSEHWVFLLEAGRGSWKKVIAPIKNYHPHFPLTELSVTINGSVVHYIAATNMWTFVVVSFDCKFEELITVPIPEDAGNKVDLVEYGGKVAIFDYTHLIDEGLVDLWVLEDAGKKEWSKKRLVLQPCQRHLVHNTLLDVRGTTHDGKVILAPLRMSSRFYILYYDMQLNDLRKVEIKGIPELSFDKKCYVQFRLMDESESVIYLET